MLRKYPFIKWSLVSLISFFLLVVGFGWWFMSLLPSKEEFPDLSSVKPESLPYLAQNKSVPRGKILAVVTSTDTMGASGKSTGYELTELSRAYYVFQANGFEVDIASPKGGEPKVVIDDEDMGIYDYAFLNDSMAQFKTRNTIPVREVETGNYRAIFFVGGKGAMFDFPDDKYIQNIVRDLYQAGGVVGAVCHGPAALVHVSLDGGQHLLANKRVSGFTNEEELLLIPDAKSIFPFMLQDKLSEQGALFEKGHMYLEQVSHENQLITGQNPWSTWKVAETMVMELGHLPKQRQITPEENAVHVLNVFETKGSKQAKALIKTMTMTENKEIERILIAKHSVIAAMQGEIGRFLGLVGLTSYAKKMNKNP
jgi:putative intracellular protease/amidase